MSENQYFNQALAGFVHDFASGGAIRHLADSGYTVTEIMNRLDFPTPKSVVAKTVWKHYTETGKIFLEEPPETGKMEKVSYVRERDEYGRTTMRRVTEYVELPGKEYIPCNFGKEMYQNTASFDEKMQKLTKSDREYIADLPWPLHTVWHEADARMRRIVEILYG